MIRSFGDKRTERLFRDAVVREFHGIARRAKRKAEIVHNRRRITADTALRLNLYFGNSAEYWLNLQAHCDLKLARRNLPAADAKQIKARRAA